MKYSKTKHTYTFREQECVIRICWRHKIRKITPENPIPAYAPIICRDEAANLLKSLRQNERPSIFREPNYRA